MKYIYLLLLLSPCLLSAQKVLQLEKRGSAKTQKMVVGTELVYQMQGDDVWYRGTIEEIRPDAGFITLSDRLVSVEKIGAIKSFKNRGWSRKFSKQLYMFAGGWVFFGIADNLIFNQSEMRAKPPLIAIPAASAIALGYAIRKIFDHKVYKINGKFRLRLLDLTPIAPVPRA
ncbi:MAG: hypothetical protein AAGG68_04125 [Bacteroidota bacterium]